MDQNKNIFRIEQLVYRSLIKDARAAYPNEACGIIFGLNDQITGFFPITNISPDASRFILDPDEHIKALYDIDKMGTQNLGIYHSHPFGTDHPSETDTQENISNLSTFFIISVHSDQWGMKAFHITSDGFTEIEIKVELSE